MPGSQTYAIPSTVFGSGVCTVTVDDERIQGELPVGINLLGIATTQSLSLPITSISAASAPTDFTSKGRCALGIIALLCAVLCYSEPALLLILGILGLLLVMTSFGMTMRILLVSGQEMTIVCPRKAGPQLTALFDGIETRRGMSPAPRTPVGGFAGSGQTNQTNQTTVVVKKSNGIGTAGFVFALLALFASGLPIANWVVWFLGALFSFIGLFKSPRGLAIAGFILSFIDVFVIMSLGAMLLAII